MLNLMYTLHTYIYTYHYLYGYLYNLHVNLGVKIISNFHAAFIATLPPPEAHGPDVSDVEDPLDGEAHIHVY